MYDGEVANNKRHGQGTFRWADGGSFHGEWVDDNPFRGVMENCSYFNTEGKYSGDVDENMRQGQGSFQYKNGEATREMLFVFDLSRTTLTL